MSTYIAGVGVSTGSHRPHDQLETMVYEAASSALADAGLNRDDVQAVCLAASDQLDGRPISSMQLAGPAGGFLKSEIKVGHDGIQALSTGLLSIEAGVHDVVLAVSWTKASESDWLRATAVQTEPLYEREIGLTPIASEAMLAGRFMAEHKISAESVRALAAARRQLAGRGPVDDAMIAWPLRGTLMPPPTDAAVAVVLTRDPARVEIAGLSWGVNGSRVTGRRDPVGSTADIAQRAFAEAGGLDIHQAIVETTDRNAVRLCMSAMGLGLVAGGADVADRLAPTAAPRLNAGGGLWASNPVFAAGLQCVVRAAKGITAGAGEAVAHSSFGVSGNGDAVVVLRRAA